MKEKIGVLIVDDHAMVRIGLIEAVTAVSDMQVTGEAANGLAAIKLYRKERADVILMDYQMPELDGVETTIQLRESFPDAKVILLSIREGEEDIWRATQAGVKGYLPKSSSMRQVLTAIRQVHAGQNSFPPEIENKIMQRSNRSDMTERELDVLHLLVAGKCNKEISTALNLSDGSVRLYVSRVLLRLDVKDRTQAAVKAIQSGLVHLGQ
ncbi:MAG: response regulator transcription factor [Verrucomicrobiae bacterium]